METTNIFKSILENDKYRKIRTANALFNNISNVLLDDNICINAEMVIQSIGNLCEMIDNQQKEITKYMVRYGTNESVERMIKSSAMNMDIDYYDPEKIMDENKVDKL